MRILNLTQHVATPEQVADGVFEPKDKSKVQALLTFDELPSGETLEKRASDLASIVFTHDCQGVMIGGAPYLMGTLENHIKYPVDKAVPPESVMVMYSFTKRVSKEEVQPDGSTRKVSVFTHVGFVYV